MTPIAIYLGMDLPVETKNSMASIDNQIKQIEEKIVQLVTQRVLLNRMRNAYSPAVNLPAELLSLIFQFACVPDCVHGTNYMPSQGVYGEVNMGLYIGPGALTPFFIGAVCSAWRQVTQSTPQLWSTVNVYVSKRHANLQASLLQLWLKYSGKRPLFVKLLEEEITDSEGADWPTDISEMQEDTDIEDSDHCPTNVTDISPAVIDVLISHSRQWHTIDLFVPYSWKSSLVKVRYELPLLTSLTLRVADTCPSLASVDIFSLAPRLQSVHLVEYSITDVHLPWEQLHHLDGEFFSSEDFLKALHLGIHLRTCQFEQFSRALEFSTSNVGPIRHEYLTSFELLMDAAHQFNALLGALTLPNLTELVLSLSDEGSILHSMIPLMHRSNFRLQMLHLHGTTPEEEQLIGFLKMQPSIKSLVLTNPWVHTGGKLSYNFVKAMTPWKTAGAKAQCTRGCEGPEATCICTDSATTDKLPYLLPMLEHFEYQGATLFNSSDLARLLASRWKSWGMIGPTAKLLHSQIPDKSQAKSHWSYPCPTSLPNVIETETPNAAARLRSVIITAPKDLAFTTADKQLLERLVAEGMCLKFVSRNFTRS